LLLLSCRLISIYLTKKSPRSRDIEPESPYCNKSIDSPQLDWLRNEGARLENEKMLLEEIEADVDHRMQHLVDHCGKYIYLSEADLLRQFQEPDDHLIVATNTPHNIAIHTSSEDVRHFS
jgi:hypothetical protein